MKNSPSATQSVPNFSNAYCPDAGDIIWLNLSPTQGQEQDGHRPVLVLSPKQFNQLTKLCVVCAMTNQGKGYPFEVAAPDGGVILADQIRTVSWPSRNAEFKASAPASVVAEVKAKLKALLSIP